MIDDRKLHPGDYSRAETGSVIVGPERDRLHLRPDHSAKDVLR